MDLYQLQKHALNDLDHILDRSGEVIYSSARTLKKGDVYLLGYNPGGISDTYHSGVENKSNDDSIGAHINNMLTKTHNSYLDENWSTANKIYSKGEAPLQKRIKCLLNYIGYDVKDVCASNLIFVKSENSNLVDYGLAGYCWRFHERVLEIVKPKVIICFGISSESAFEFLRSLLNINQDNISQYPSGHGSWQCKYFKSSILGMEVHVIGVPHLSYYDISNRTKVLNWIKSKTRLEQT